MVKCKLCDEVFPNVVALGQHQKLAHPGSGYSCYYCDKVFNNRQARSQHIPKCPSKDVSNASASADSIEISLHSQSSDIRCGICELFVKSMVDLCSHLRDLHETPATIHELSFDSVLEFEQWKLNVESNGRFQFRQRNRRANQNATIEYLYCHRSGDSESISERKRAPKKLGSIKTGYTCSTFAVVTTQKDCQRVTVKCCLDHYTHDDQLARIRITDQTRKEVCRHYQDGRSVAWIVDKLRSDMTETDGRVSLKRENIINRRDVYNIVAQLGIRKERCHNDDAINVDLLQHPAPVNSAVDDQEEEKILNLLRSIEMKIKTKSVKNVDALTELVRKLSAADAFASLYSQNPAPCTRAVGQSDAPNKQMATRPRVFQESKKRKRTENTLGKLDDAAISAIRELYDDSEPEVCAHCFIEKPNDDDDDENGDIGWLRCDKSRNLYHTKCVNVREKTGTFLWKICI